MKIPKLNVEKKLSDRLIKTYDKNVHFSERTIVATFIQKCLYSVYIEKKVLHSLSLFNLGNLEYTNSTLCILVSCLFLSTLVMNS